MSIDQPSKTMRHQEGPEIAAPRARQGDRRTMTFWILLVSTMAAIVIGIVLLGLRDNPPAETARKQEVPATSAPAAPR